MSSRENIKDSCSQRVQSNIIPVGSYPTPFLGYLLFYVTDPNHKTRYPKKGVGYEPLGGVCFGGPATY